LIYRPTKAEVLRLDLLPHGKPLRLYQRIAGRPKVYPKAARKQTPSVGFVAAPTQQKD
jgi:hypothetical protein